jgi:hypothetical protein
MSNSADIKPGNCFLCSDGSIVLGDYGSGVAIGSVLSIVSKHLSIASYISMLRIYVDTLSADSLASNILAVTSTLIFNTRTQPMFDTICGRCY